MPVPVTRKQFDDLAPKAHVVYREGLATIDESLSRGEINATPLRLAHFFAQLLHETAGFQLVEESLFYTSTERLMRVWPKRFKTAAAALPFIRNPKALAEEVYGGRMGNAAPGDGWKYRGRGVPMLTGRDNYRLTGKRLGVDFEAHPELVIDPRYVFAVAVDFWTRRGINLAADADDLKAVTRLVNGGLVGLDDRAYWLKKTKAVWPS